jgi:hypothetical protein
MQFDPSVLCLPFVLPVEAIGAAVDDAPIWPADAHAASVMHA